MNKHLLLTVGTGSDKKQRLVNMGLVKIARNSIDGTNLTFNDDSFIAVNESLEQIEAQLLRDEFAMSALNGLLASGEKISKENTGMYSRHAAQIAHKAGVYAGAMLKERMK